jgi:hypothetical protein
MDVTPTMCALAAAVAASRLGQMPLMPLGSCACQNARNKIQFNGVGGLRTYINFIPIDKQIGQNMKMQDQEKDRR